ncbi:MAG: aminodeoxychorismate/anthranilate synthase component II [Sphingobacteriales bacterium]|nr:MAG: aminodeoxychorismate/anthranilate synthase component II [Sphingobacteriales bacterium]
MWILIDNYDSFTWILHHYLLETGNDCRVIRNDEISVEELIYLEPERIILSPGPETPQKAGICLDVIRHFHVSTPILGICLGHQALGVHFGAALQLAPYPMHGKVSPVVHDGYPLFAGLPKEFPVMRYHSLVINHLEGTGLRCIARSTDDKQVMAVVHEQFPCVGIQFHPESIGTDAGPRILAQRLPPESSAWLPLPDRHRAPVQISLLPCLSSSRHQPCLARSR